MDAETRDRLKALFEEAAIEARAARFEAAEVIYRRIVEVIPRDAVANYNLATMLLGQGKYEEGFRRYEARAYVGMPNVVKPEYRERVLRLPPEIARSEWGRQMIEIALPPTLEQALE
jgi:hypothetical protein